MSPRHARSASSRSSTRTNQKRRYGWLPDLPDRRDHHYRVPEAAVPPPTHIDLRRTCPAVYDQGDLGSCTANAIAGAIEFDQKKQAISDIFVPSRLFIYYNERALEGTIDSDSGAMIRDGIKSVARQGAPHETLWPYAIAKFRAKPSSAAFVDAGKHTAVSYARLTQDLIDLKACLAAGNPFVFGFAVYESFESETVARTGRVPMPKPGEAELGGHAVMAVGYNDSTGTFTVRNSWGPSWGDHGYFTMPYAYLVDGDLSDDFWTIQTVQ